MGGLCSPWGNRAEHVGASGLSEPGAFIKTGNDLLDVKLAGGIPHGSLALIEGPSSAGKSVLCQHFAHGSLLGGRGVAYITSENTAIGLTNKMDSIGLDVTPDLETGKFQIFALDTAAPDPHPELSVESLARGIERLPPKYEVVIVDSITDIAADSQDRTIIDLFSGFKRLCSRERTMIVALHPDIFEDRLLTRLRLLCDANFVLSVRNSGEKLVKELEVRKVHNAELDTDNVFKFEVAPGIGMRVLRTTTVRI